MVATFIPCFLLVADHYDRAERRVSDLSDRVQDLGDKGDLSSRIYISMNDDFGELTSKLNGFLDQLSTLIVSLKDETRIVAETAARLSASTDESKMALALMKSSVDKMVKEGERQNQQITESPRRHPGHRRERQERRGAGPRAVGGRRGELGLRERDGREHRLGGGAGEQGRRPVLAPARIELGRRGFDQSPRSTPSRRSRTPPTR